MRPFLIAAAAALGALVGAESLTQDHWILNWATPIAVGRIDPIISPGSVSAHVHNIVGASNFNMNASDYARTQEAKCSSIIVGADKSNYWAPLLYFIHANGTFQPIINDARIYYFTKSTEVQPFPEGLRMISGLAISRNASAIQSQGIEIMCDHVSEGQWLPNGTSHPEGCSSVTMGIYLPSCGNGSLDSTDHFSHMTWPVDSGGGLTWINLNGATCPDSHPIKYPTVFVEFNYYLSEGQTWRADDVNLALSTGDTTGLGYHLDFQNGWDNDVLTNAIKECGFGHGVGDQLGDCAPFVPTYNQSATYDCALEGEIPDEEIGFYRPIPQLPGCNPLWTVDDDDIHQECTDYDNPGWVGPNVYFENLRLLEHVPVAFNLTSNYSLLEDEFIPSLGDPGASRLREWGTWGADSSSVTVGTIDEINANLADSTEENLTAAGTATGHDFVDTATKWSATSDSGTSTVSSSPAASASTTSSSSSASSLTSALANAGVAAAVVTSDSTSQVASSSSPESTSSAATPTAAIEAAATTTTKACKRSKRGITKAASGKKARSGVHAHRKHSKRDMLNHRAGF
ncbi:hypothetical protein Q5752_003969 [Cryptotrichosporon argae]